MIALTVELSGVLFTIGASNPPVVGGAIASLRESGIVEDVRGRTVMKRQRTNDNEVDFVRLHCSVRRCGDHISRFKVSIE